MIDMTQGASEHIPAPDGWTEDEIRDLLACAVGAKVDGTCIYWDLNTGTWQTAEDVGAECE